MQCPVALLGYSSVLLWRNVVVQCSDRLDYYREEGQIDKASREGVQLWRCELESQFVHSVWNEVAMACFDAEH